AAEASATECSGPASGQEALTAAAALAAAPAAEQPVMAAGAAMVRSVAECGLSRPYAQLLAFIFFHLPEKERVKVLRRTLALAAELVRGLLQGVHDTGGACIGGDSAGGGNGGGGGGQMLLAAHVMLLLEVMLRHVGSASSCGGGGMSDELRAQFLSFDAIPAALSPPSGSASSMGSPDDARAEEAAATACAAAPPGVGRTELEAFWYTELFPAQADMGPAAWHRLGKEANRATGSAEGLRLQRLLLSLLGRGGAVAGAFGAGSGAGSGNGGGGSGGGSDGTDGNAGVVATANGHLFSAAWRLLAAWPPDPPMARKDSSSPGAAAAPKGLAAAQTVAAAATSGETPPESTIFAAAPEYCFRYRAALLGLQMAADGGWAACPYALGGAECQSLLWTAATELPALLDGDPVSVARRALGAGVGRASPAGLYHVHAAVSAFCVYARAVAAQALADKDLAGGGGAPPVADYAHALSAVTTVAQACFGYYRGLIRGRIMVQHLDQADAQEAAAAAAFATLASGNGGGGTKSAGTGGSASGRDEPAASVAAATSAVVEPSAGDVVVAAGGTAAAAAAVVQVNAVASRGGPAAAWA
ncbi:unnamed protein product, partial [Phaeothamnion confervicola]